MARVVLVHRLISLLRYPPLRLSILLAASSAGMISGPRAHAADSPLPDWLAIAATNRTRGEFVDWFRPKPGAAKSGAERYDFVGNQLRVAVRATFPHVQIGLELQDTRIGNLPNDASLPFPEGPLGPGGAYFANTAETWQGEPFLKRGFATLRRAGLAATLGRFEIRGGLETVPSDPTIQVLKRERVAERLVGPFGFSHVTRSFDGGLVAYDRPEWNVTAFGARPTQGGFEVSANTEVHDLTLAGLAVTAKRVPGAPPADLSVFYLYYDDRRSDVVKLDNRPFDLRDADREMIGIHTLGAHAITAIEAGPGIVDMVGWGALQRGAWGELDQAAWAWAIEGGYQLAQLPARPWVRLGWNRSSGDDDPLDGDHGTFFQLIPTARIYAQLPFYNLMNSSDVFTQLILHPVDPLLVRMEYHCLDVTEGQDLWYSGSGVTKQTLFGYTGSPAGGKHSLAQVVDATVGIELGEHVALQLYFGQAFGKTVVAETFAGTNARYGFLEVLLSF